MPIFQLDLDKYQDLSVETDNKEESLNHSITVFDANLDSCRFSETRLSIITPEEGKPYQIPALSSNLNRRKNRESMHNEFCPSYFTLHSPQKPFNNLSQYEWPKDSFMKNSKSNVKNH